VLVGEAGEQGEQGQMKQDGKGEQQQRRRRREQGMKEQGVEVVEGLWVKFHEGNQSISPSLPMGSCLLP
jgi:hypothetical protein